MIVVRWGLDELAPLLAELGVERPLVVTSARWRELRLPAARRFEGVRRHVPDASVREAVAAAAGADGLLALGGGSAVDTAKAVSAATGLPVVSLPTTYAGAEWTPYFGVRDEERRVKGGGSGARLAAVVYEPRLTLGLPREESGGTALNALAHCAEALYVRVPDSRQRDEAERHALAGAHLIGAWLPRVLADGSDLEARTRLLEGAAEAGRALAASGLALAHALAQALGARYGAPHGALNAICLPPALRFNTPVARDALRRLGEALGADDAIQRIEELARLAGFARLRDLGVPAGDLEQVAEAAAARPGARANPRPATPAQIAALLRGVW